MTAIDFTRPSASYPDELESDITLRDGSQAHVRPTRPTDARALDRFIGNLSQHSRRFRFFCDWTDYGEFIEHAVDNDYRSRLDLIATAGGQIVAHAMYAQVDEGRAEVAFAVADAWHGRGLATVLLGRLAAAASASGIRTFEAITLPENEEMLAVLHGGGFPATWRSEPGEVHCEFSTAAIPKAVGRLVERAAPSSQ